MLISLLVDAYFLPQAQNVCVVCFCVCLVYFFECGIGRVAGEHVVGAPFSIFSVALPPACLCVLCVCGIYFVCVSSKTPYRISTAQHTCVLLFSGRARQEKQWCFILHFLFPGLFCFICCFYVYFWLSARGDRGDGRGYSFPLA